MKAIIIGSGIGGMAMAIRMKVQGYEVVVHESYSQPGGKLNNLSLGAYRFDAGPSLFTMPSKIEELFTLANRPIEQYFEYKKLDEVCRYFWDDETRLTVLADIDDFDAEVVRTFGEEKGTVKAYLADSAFKYKILNGLFLEKSLRKWSTWFSKDALAGYLNLHKLDLFNTLHGKNALHFKHARTVQMFDRYATYNGSSPYKSPGTMGIIPHLEYNDGTFFPTGGMYSISKALHSLALDLGVKFHFNSAVEEILIENKGAIGVRLANQELILADKVVSNMDVFNTYHTLLKDFTAKPHRILNQEKSGSGLIFYWGVRKSFDQLGLHNIFFTENYQEEFRCQFEDKSIYSDPTVYLNISSKHHASDAPEGCENWFILINAPNNIGQDWDAIIEKTRADVVKKLSKNLGVDVSKYIECEAILDPRTIESRTSSSQGALYGNSSNNRYAAFLRHSNKSAQIENLFFVGGSVHPGGGIPLALSSAKIAADLCK